MVDSIRPAAPNARDDGKVFAIHPEGMTQLVLTDLIDLGDKVEAYPGSPEKLSHKAAFLYQSSQINPDTSRPFELSVEVTVSWNEKANMRKWLGNQRGRPFSDQEALNPPDLATFVGMNGLGNVIHQANKAGTRTYAKLTTIAPLMPGMAPIPPSAGYQRAPFWASRKEEYRKQAQAFKDAAGVTSAPAPLDQMPPALAGPATDDDLPFNPMTARWLP